MPKTKFSLPLLTRLGVNFTAFVFAVLLQVIIMPHNVFAQDVTIKGKVTGEAGAPLAGVSISLKGTSKGTTTDNNGNFSISAVKGNTLVISAIGYAEKEVKIGNDVNLSIRLESTEKSLGEVVVVGYGTQRRKEVTGAVTSVNERTLREVPAANLAQGLQGRAAGLEIQRTGTRPGSVGQIRIRGSRSINGSNDPLFVVDGIPFEGSLNDINPDDVASIDILKDAASTAIYGSRAANGVILITTKKGKSGETRVSYSSYYGIGTIANKYPVFNSQEYQAMRNISPWGSGYLPDEVKGISLGRQTDWQDLMYSNSFRTDHNLTVTGGSNGSTFSLGGGYFKENAVIPGQDFTRYSLRTAIDSKIGRRIKVGLTSLNSLGITNGSQFVNPWFPILALSPLTGPYDSLGNVVNLPNGNIDDNNGYSYSPLLLKNNNNNWVDRVRRIRTINSLYAEVQIVNGLRYRVNLGASYAQQQNAQFQSANTTARPSYFRGNRGSIASVGNSEEWGYTLENLLLYDKTFKKHKVGFTGLYSIQESQNIATTVSKDSIAEDFVQFYNLGLSTATPPPTVGGGESRSALISYMARVNYSYDEKYLLSITGRIDGSSKLAPGNKWQEYYGFSAGWNMTSEKFMNKLDWISSLKLRGGYGRVSNQAIGAYQNLGLVNNNNGLAAPANIIRYNYGNRIVTGFDVLTTPNPNLDWEYTNNFNIGVDFAVLRNRISGSAEYYNMITEGLHYAVTLPPTSGIRGQYLRNSGRMQNRGFEFSVSSLNVESKSGFTWSTDLNLFFNQNKILKLIDGVKEDVANGLFEGYSFTSIYDYKKTGIWQTNEAAQAAVYGSVPGQIKLADISGPTGKPDGIINPLYDRSVIGNMDAKVQGGITNRFGYKNFDLSVVVYARLGGLLISQIHQPLSSYLTIMDGRRNGVKVDYWTPTNPSNWFPMPAANIVNATVASAWSTLGYYKASFARVRSINLGYTLNQNTLKKIGAASTRVYFTIDNVGILYSPYYKQTGIDPEGTATGNNGVSTPGNIRGGNNGIVTINANTPPARTFTFGLNITF